MPAYSQDLMAHAAVVEDDRHSTSTVASTVGTTASLQSRLAALTVELDRESMGPGITEAEEGEFDEQEDIVEFKEEELLGLLDRERDPLETCSRLFLPVGSNPIPLKQLSMYNVEQLRQHGYAIVDGFIGLDIASKIRQETLNLNRRGKLGRASQLNVSERGSEIYIDRKARGDNIMWLHLGEAPANTVIFAPLMVGFQKLLEDLVEIMHLKHKFVEYQLAHYPGDGSHYLRHRDAFPDDGGEEQQRRVTAVVYMNPGWRQEDGGCLRIWPPRRRNTPSRLMSSAQVVHFINQRSHALIQSDIACCDCSDVSSLRSEINGLPVVLGAGSTTSSVVAEASTVAGGEFNDASSVDDGSVENGGRILNGRCDNERYGIDWSDVDGERVLDIAPLAGRLVLFMSGAVDHAVQPCSSDRVAITAWFQ
eukprot:TRINITY_DN45592_c0_g2_i1.p1 TRINITY_DN45592_c0_g2~~TRINITY_DN45592_c0_g2_i1.p1  ORF type:complete len:422 (-),score=46.19 TRINITY_DN45592_c0_g2_i1:435-1700(-)